VNIIEHDNFWYWCIGHGLTFVDVKGQTEPPKDIFYLENSSNFAGLHNYQWIQFSKKSFTCII